MYKCKIIYLIIYIEQYGIFFNSWPSYRDIPSTIFIKIIKRFLFFLKVVDINTEYLKTLIIHIFDD